MKLRVAGAQIPVKRNIYANIKSINRAIDFAVSEKADILLTPEGSLSGYKHRFSREKVVFALDTITTKARVNKLGLALGTCFVEPEDGCCYNQIRFYDTDGKYLGFHSKTLNCGTLTEPPRGEIEHFAVKPLRIFSFKDITIGGLICNDLWADPCWTPIPDIHLTQKLADMGARIIFHAVNGGRDASEFMKVIRQYAVANLRMRARAGNLWIVTVNSCEPVDMPCSSPSGVISPGGDWVKMVPIKGERLFVHTIEIK